MFDLGSISVAIKADLSAFTHSLNEAKNKLSDFRSGLTGLNDSLDGVRSKGNLAVAALAAATTYLGKLGVDQAAQNEKNLASFTTLFQDEAKAFEYLAQVKKDAIDTPFDLQGLVDINQTLLGTGLEAGKARTMIMGMGDVMAAMGKGSAEMQRMGNTLSQVFGKGKADAVDMKELVNSGWVTARQDIAATMKVSMSQFEKMVESGQVGFEEIQATIARTTGEGGRFYDAMGKLTNTFGGQMARLGDTINLTLGDIMQESGLFGVLKNGLDSLSTFVEDNKGAIIQFFKDLGQQVREFMPKVQEVSNWVITNKDALIAGILGIGAALTTLYVLSQVTALLVALTNPIGQVAILVGLLSAAWTTNFYGIRDITQQVATQVVWFFDNYIKPAMEMFQTWFTNVFAPAINNIWTNFLMPALSAFVGFFRDNWDLIQAILTVAWQVLSGIVQVGWALISGLLTLGLNILAGDWGAAWQTIVDMTNGSWDALKGIFDSVVSFVKNWGGVILDHLTKPFRDAWNSISDLMGKIRDAADPNKRHSPSLVDLVTKGVKDMNSAWSGLTMPVLGGQTLATSIGGGLPTTSGISIDLRGSTISSMQDANQYAEMIGDKIIKKLQMNVRF